jgi:hypothetical protein
MKIRKGSSVEPAPVVVDKWRNEALEYLKVKSNKPFWYAVFGNTMVVAIRHDNEIDIWHTKIVDKATLIATTQVVWEDAHFLTD